MALSENRFYKYPYYILESLFSDEFRNVGNNEEEIEFIEIGINDMIDKGILKRYEN
jgi:hypothetical protein